MKKRLLFIDIAKLLAISAVIFDHSQYFTQPSSSFFVLRIWIFSFFLQIFFLTPGLTSKDRPFKHLNEWVGFIGLNFRRIMVPYYIWGLIGGYSVDIHLIESLLTGTQSALETCTDSIIWFLPALFMSRIFYQGVICLTDGVIRRHSAWCKGILAILLLTAGIELGKWSGNTIPWGADIGLVGCSLMLTGSLMKKAILRLEQKGMLIKTSAAFLFLVASVLLGYANMPFEQFPDGQVIYESSVWMARGMYGKNGLLFLLSSVSGCLLILTLAMMLDKCRFFSLAGQHTLSLMVVHNKVFPYAVALLSWIPFFNDQTGIVIQVIATLVAMLYCAPWCFLISRFAPYLEGHTADAHLQAQSRQPHRSSTP